MVKKDKKYMLNLVFLGLFMYLVFFYYNSNKHSSFELTANYYDHNGNLISTDNSKLKGNNLFSLMSISGLTEKSKDYLISNNIAQLAPNVNSVSFNVSVTNTGNGAFNLSYSVSDLSIVNVDKNTPIVYPFPSQDLPGAITNYTGYWPKPTGNSHNAVWVNRNGSWLSYAETVPNSLNNLFRIENGEEVLFGGSSLKFFLNKPFTKEQQIAKVDIGEKVNFNTDFYDVTAAPVNSNYAIAIKIMADSSKEKIYYWRFNRI